MIRRIWLAFLTLIGLNIALTPSVSAGTTKSLPQLQQELTSLALQIAQGYGLTLDFSHESIRDVERVLGFVHESYRVTGDDSGIRGIAIEFAAYIVTTIQRNTGDGRWERHHPEIGQDFFPLYWRSSAIFPYAWCMKRIVDGDADNIWTKYEVFVLKELK